MDTSEASKQLQKNIRNAIEVASFPPSPLRPLQHTAVERTIDRIAADDRLAGLFARITDDESMRRTFLSLYFQARYRSY